MDEFIQIYWRFSNENRLSPLNWLMLYKNSNVNFDLEEYKVHEQKLGRKMAKKNISKENMAIELILPDIKIYNKYI